MRRAADSEVGKRGDERQAEKDRGCVREREEKGTENFGRKAEAGE